MSDPKRNRYAYRPPLYGMALVFLALALVAVTKYLDLGWWSAVGYAGAAVVFAAGFVLAFRDFS